MFVLDFKYVKEAICTFNVCVLVCVRLCEVLCRVVWACYTYEESREARQCGSLRRGRLYCVDQSESLHRQSHRAASESCLTETKTETGTVKVAAGCRECLPWSPSSHWSPVEYQS